MANFTAKDVQKLRQASGAGMMDAKRALEECDGDMDAAAQWLREHGLAEKVKREDREAAQGAVAVVKDNDVAAIVELRCETDFVAKAAEFVAVADDLAALVAAHGEDAIAERSQDIERLVTTLKENISVGRVYRLEAKDGEVVDTYLHQQSGRGVNAVTSAPTPVPRAVALKDDSLRTILSDLLSGPQPGETLQGLTSAIPTTTQLINLCLLYTSRCV